MTAAEKHGTCHVTNDYLSRDCHVTNVTCHVTNELPVMCFACGQVKNAQEFHVGLL